MPHTESPPSLAVSARRHLSCAESSLDRYPFAPALKAALLAVGTVSAVAGAVMCFAQSHLKRLLAFSTISHMGLMFIGFALLSPQGMAGLGVYLIGHSLAKAALFLATGILLLSTSTAVTV